jgi:RNA polymerase sigma-70 factor, ECF subfamily
MLVQHLPPSASNRQVLPCEVPPAAPAEADDAPLIQAASAGDGSAYSSLVRKYQTRLCNSLQRVCGSFVDAQDVAQEAFLRGYLKLPSFSRACSFYTWLFRIAINVNASQRRRRQAQAFDMTTLQGLSQQLVDRSEPQVERLLRQQRAEQVQRALAELPSEQRAILVLREIEDRDYDAIAGELRIPVGTVRSRLHRARLQLRETLVRLTS